jgi:hypothetical protein
MRARRGSAGIRLVCQFFFFLLAIVFQAGDVTLPRKISHDISWLPTQPKLDPVDLVPGVFIQQF